MSTVKTIEVGPEEDGTWSKKKAATWLGVAAAASGLEKKATSRQLRNKVRRCMDMVQAFAVLNSLKKLSLVRAATSGSDTPLRLAMNSPTCAT